MMKKLLVVVITSLFFVCCGDDDGGPAREIFDLPQSGVFIGCQGNFGKSTASLSFYDPQSGEVENYIYQRANRAKLGDVIESLKIVDGRLFVVVNASGRVVVLDPDNFTHKGQITNQESPRYITTYNNRLYISDMYTQRIGIYDAITLQSAGSIETGKDENTGANLTTERMVVHNGYLYAVSWSYGDKVLKINLATNMVEKTLQVVYQPNSIEVDADGFLWVLSDGGWMGEGVPSLTRIDTNDFSVKETYEFPDASASPKKMTTSNDGKNLYFIYNEFSGTLAGSGVYMMGINDGQLPAVPIIAQPAGSIFSGLGVDPKTGEIYVGDAIDYTQDGIVFRYSADGKQQLDSFRVGIDPLAFCFKP